MTAGSLSISTCGPALRPRLRQRAGAVRDRRRPRWRVDPSTVTVARRTVQRAGRAAQLVRGAGRRGRPRGAGRPRRAGAVRGAAGRRHRRAPARPAGQGRRPAPVRARPAAARPAGSAGCSGRRRPAPGCVDVDARPWPATGRRGPGRLVPRRGRPDEADGAAGGRRGCGPRRCGPKRTPCRTRTTWTASCGPARTRRSRSSTTASTTAPPPRRARHDGRGDATRRPFVAHASIAPSCAVARWSRTAGVAGLVAQPGHRQPGPGDRRRARPRPGDRRRASTSRAPAATATTPPTTSRSTRCCWPGRSRARPVQVLWSRQDELSLGAVRARRWSPTSRPTVDAAGRLASWRYDVCSQGHSSRPGLRRRARPARRDPPGRRRRRTRPPVDPPPANGAGSTRNALPGYDLPSRRVTGHRLTETPIRTLGAALARRLLQRLRDRVDDGRGGRGAPAPTRWSSGWRTCPTSAAARVLRTAAERRRLGPRACPRAPASASATPATRAPAPGAPSSPRSRRRPTVRVRRLTDRRRRRPGGEPGRRAQPDRGRRGAGDELDAAGAGALRPAPDHQHDLGVVPDPAVLGGARRCGSSSLPATATRRSAPGRPPRARPPAAIGNALAAAVGVRVRDLPLTPEAVVQAIEGM